MSEHRREERGRGHKRGQLLLVFLFLLTLSAAGQREGDPSPEESDRLRRMVASGSVEEKRTALFEIRNYRSAAASSVAVPALRDSNELVRATAASSVVFLPKPDAARAVLPLLDDKAEFVRREAAFALGTIGDPSAMQGLVRVMERDRILEVRSAAAQALGKVGDVAAVASLIALLRKQPREEEEFVRRSAARSIGQIAQIVAGGDRKVVTPQNYLPDNLRDFDGPSAIPSGFSTAVDVLIGVLGSSRESDDTRREAAFSLGAIGDPRSVPALQASRSASDPYLAEISREALIKIERRNKMTGSED